MAFLSEVSSYLLVALFFGGSIFVHELGHFLAARRRGVKVERFSIGFGPAICKWVGRDGVEYRLSWIPLGGYVALPQLADLSTVEGESQEDYAKLPPPSYTTKVIVFVAGAVFNLVFALLLSTVVWWVGIPEPVEPSANQIGLVAEKIKLPDGTQQVSPAAAAGLKPGDIVLSIDGKKVESWTDIASFVSLGAGRTEDGRPEARFRILRQGVEQELLVHPELVTRDRIRRIGIGPAFSLAVAEVTPGTPAEQAGLRAGDVLKKVGDSPVLGEMTLAAALQATPAPTSLEVRRGDQTVSLVLPAGPFVAQNFGVALRLETQLAHPNPFGQLWDHATLMVRNLQSWLHPKSDVDLSKFSGPVGIFKLFHQAAEDHWLTLLWITAVINVNLALFNLLPLPILDGGHILFATLAKLRGRPIPAQTIAALQSGFLILLAMTAIYVTIFDVRRLSPEKPTPPPPAQVDGK